MRAPGKKSPRREAPATISARLVSHVTLDVRADRNIAACFEGYSVDLGQFSTGVGERAQKLRAGLPLASFASGCGIDKETDRLVRRLARQGLLEYRLAGSPRAGDQVVIEPQTPDYWPQTPKLRDTDVLVVSRFAYMRRRGDEMVLESPRAGALFRICDPKIAAVIATLAKPQRIKQLRRQGAAGVALLALLVDCQIVFKVDAAGDRGLRASEGDHHLVLWDFHDLVFHTRSMQGRHANPLGGVYPHAGAIAPLPAVRPRWPGNEIDLRKFSAQQSDAAASVTKLLRERRSTRSFDSERPITLVDLARFLDGTARILSRGTIETGEGGSPAEYTVRPYPSAGASYELELYLTVDKCDGLGRGFYHYDAAAHALVPLVVAAHRLEALLAAAQFAMDASAVPQILLTIAARFGRISWKYSSLAYSLILKDVGVLLQTFHVMAAGIGLGGCAIGIADIDLFAKMTGIEFHVEGPVGQFALGRAASAPPQPSIT